MMNIMKYSSFKQH